MRVQGLNGDQILKMIDEMIDTLNDFKHGAMVSVPDEARGGKPRMERTPNLTRLLVLMAAATRDGYPTSSMKERSAHSVLDDRGDPMPPLSDPTGELATADHKILDPIRYNGETVFRGLTGALGDLRMARGALIRVAQQTDLGPGEPGCKSCARNGEWVTIAHNERCLWCYRFWLAEKVDPPLDLLEARNAGKRITQQMVDEALHRSRRRRSARVS